MQILNKEKSKNIKLDFTLDKLNLTIGTYYSLSIGLKSKLKKELRKIKVKDIISLSYNELKNECNLKKEEIMELLSKIHLLGLKFDFEQNCNIDINIKNLNIQECLKLQTEYLTKIRAYREETEKIKMELQRLECNKCIIDERVLALTKND